jgi:hypothetical protein
VPWGYVGGIQCDPIEKKPFFHAHPGAVLRQNSDSTELHSSTMLQACSQAVDLKVDRHFGEGQVHSGQLACRAVLVND